MLYSCINKKHERSKTCARGSQKYETRILKSNPYVRASHTPLFPHLKKKQTALFVLQRQQRATKQKLGKHALFQTKRQSHGRLTFPPTGVRREKNVRVPKVLAAGALGKKHLQILFCRKWNKRSRNSSSLLPDGRKQWRWSCDVLVESVFSCFFLFFLPLACLFLLLLFSLPSLFLGQQTQRIYSLYTALIRRDSMH